jgi:hypothetical protein
VSGNFLRVVVGYWCGAVSLRRTQAQS